MVGLLCSQPSEGLLRTEDDRFDFAFVLGVLLSEQVHHLRHFVLVAAGVDGESLGIAGFGNAATRLVRSPHANASRLTAATARACLVHESSMNSPVIPSVGCVCKPWIMQQS